jgi:RHS repeat-associated protein
VTYFPNGAIAGFTYGNGIVHSLTQNARGLPDRSRDADGSTSIHDDSYFYDEVGNVAAIADGVSGARGDRDMTYDALNRLTLVTGADGAPSPMFGTASYTYDVLDNLKHVHVTAGAQLRDQEYFYDAHNRLTNLIEDGESVIGLDYDVQGNLSNKNGTTYTFDYGNRMRAGGPETYRYDVQGRRIRSSSTAGVIYSLYAQSGQLLFQRDERSSKRRQYIYLGGSLVAESDLPLTGGTATVTYQHTDALGTPIAITNSSKTVIERREYEPYGYQTTPALQDGPNYTGHVADAATGLIYMQARYYDPLCGCFLSNDPVTALKGPFNRYWYANDNPYRFVDPDGRVTVQIEMSAADKQKYKDQIRQFTKSVKKTEKNLFKANAPEAAKFKATTFVISSKALPASVAEAAGANAQNVMGYETPSGVGDNVTHLTTNIFKMGDSNWTIDSYFGRSIGKGSESNLAFGYLHEWRHDFPENGKFYPGDSAAGEKEANNFADKLLPIATGNP